MSSNGYSTKGEDIQTINLTVQKLCQEKKSGSGTVKMKYKIPFYSLPQLVWDLKALLLLLYKIPF